MIILLTIKGDFATLSAMTRQWRMGMAIQQNNDEKNQEIRSKSNTEQASAL